MESKPLDHLVTEFAWTRYQIVDVSAYEDGSLTIAVFDPSSFEVSMLGEIVNIRLPLCFRAEIRFPLGPVGEILVEREIPEAFLADVPSDDLTPEERNELRFLRMVDREGRTMLAAVADGYTWSATEARAY
ncbi:hypothetical protein OV090_19240 [Nannocystis sp. RBIL2]|uniref:hypothetical protein n=1 Tax=Nannocystis sp. RBIL2 TaxID=2996788 RepID=UPI00226F34D7|nr:hypothetical protein [Nannocystis sp. RBIL2]MCY1066914.1 hypothetical protein [Nannocystis sp. RBIL2]